MENEEGEGVWPSARRIRPKQHHTMLYDDDHAAHNAFWLWHTDIPHAYYINRISKM